MGPHICITNWCAKGYIWVHRLALFCDYGVSPLLSGYNVEYLEGETW